jgi:alkylated DNA repair dioxygenase AlkB
MSSKTKDLFSESVIDFSLPDAKIRYYPSFFSAKKSSFFLKQLKKSIQWKQNIIKMYGKENPVPRLEAWYGDPGKSYSYSGIQMDPIPWTDELKDIKSTVEVESRIKFNSVLINFYRDGKDRVAWHSDDEKELGQNPVIGSVSFGAERKFKLRHKKYKSNGLKKEILLQNGSFLLMQGATQHHWIHEIPRTAKPIESRINLTFRVIQ